MTKPNKQSNESERIENWLAKLAAHFGAELGEEQISIFSHALRSNTSYQIDEAFDRCLNECLFMPKLADIHERMPSQRWPTENPGRFVVHDPPLLDVIRPIAVEMSKAITGKEYHELDAKEIFKVFFLANRERYIRIGLNPDAWLTKNSDVDLELSRRNLQAQAIAITKHSGYQREPGED